MIISVTGGREYKDSDRVYSTMDSLLESHKISGVIHGGARGLDSIVDSWCKSRGVHSIRVDALWDSLGKKAGSVRNEFMTSLRPKLCVVFSGGSGTLDMKNRCIRKLIPILEVK